MSAIRKARPSFTPRVIRRVGSAQLRAMHIARDTGGCVAGKGGDASWRVCERLLRMGLFRKSHRTCYALTDAGRDFLSSPPTP